MHPPSGPAAPRHERAPRDGALDAIRERVLDAAANGTPLRLRGSGSKDFYGESLAGEPLELGPYRGIVHYDPSELVLTARCGTRLSELADALAAQRQYLPFEPPTFGADPTLGGIIASGLAGSRRPYAGAVRDFVLGTVLLSAQGELLHFGGEVMKNVAGFDVSRLLCGSMGVLGVIASVSVKILPRPPLETTVCFEMSARESLAAFNRWAMQPLPLSGAAWCAGLARVRLSGTGAAVRAARAQLGGTELDPQAAARFWSWAAEGPAAQAPDGRLWRVSVPQHTAPLPLPGEQLIDWGGALRWHATDLPAGHVREVARAHEGSALCWRGAVAPGERLHPLGPAERRLHERLKAQFDPRGIFNPGRLIAGL